MIKTSQSEIKTVEAAGAKRGLACWNEDPQTQALRVELTNGSFFIFPVSHFVAAEFTSANDGDSLKLMFSTHRVRIEGRHLREVALALQKLSVEWIKEAPEKYAALADPHAAFIKSIEVSEVGAESPSS